MTLTREEVEELRERSKDDRGLIVGSEIRQLCDLAQEALAVKPIASVCVMQTTAGPDYFVQIDCDGRDATIHKFKQRYKAEYEVAYFNWLFHGGDEPCLLDYKEDSWPGKPHSSLTEPRG